jgi:predicted O-methyltransferase YrrM
MLSMITMDRVDRGIEKLESLADPEVFNSDGFHLGVKGSSLCVEKEIGRMLYDLVLKEKPHRILELGTAHGYSTCWFLLGLNENKKGRIISIDHFDRQPKIWDEVKVPTERLSYFAMESDQFIKECSVKFDVVFLDTHHRIEMITADIEKLIPFLNEGAKVLVHDTNYVPQMGIELQQYFDNRKDFDYTEMKKSCGLGIATYKGEVNDISSH